MASTRADIAVTRHAEGATLSFVTRNTLVAWVVSLVGAFLSLGPLTVLAQGISMSDASTVLSMAGLTALIFWGVWRIGWRPRPFRIVFTADGLRVGGRRFAYTDIQSHTLAPSGGAVFDPVSMPLPRGHTLGPHICIQVGGRHLPVTPGLKDDQAREVFRLFQELVEEYGRTPATGSA